MEKEIISDIRSGFETAYINGSIASNIEYKPTFVSNNPDEGKKVIASIEEELLRCDSFQISVAFITMSGIVPLLMTLKELEKRNIPGMILTTDYLTFSEPRALKKLNELKNITIKMYDTSSCGSGFHTKGYIFKKNEVYRIIIGSSNITKSALTSGKEWNTKIVATDQGEVVNEIVREFDDLWNSEYSLSYEEFFDVYKERYEIIKHQREEALKDSIPSIAKYTLKPNSMQEEFIVNLRRIINSGEKRALLISATGTGKTYASAFAMRELGFKKVLFVVHRVQLAKQAKKSFERVFNDSVSMGIVGGGLHEYDCDFVFAMVETLNKDQHLFQFEEDDFDCIILDEAHHSTAGTYQKIMNYFTPKLFLGMTATPDKKDDCFAGKNVYELFHYQIAHEIRLQKAMEDDLLCPFHYFGISDIVVCDNGGSKNKKISSEEFNLLTDAQRVDHVIEQAKYYGYSGERVKGLVFCRLKKEAETLSKMFNERGLRTVALSSDSPQRERELAFERLAMDESDAQDDYQPLDYIFSVDILNEGVDIVEVNQVIMLRPTESPIVFIQQLGRGLRKAKDKEFVVILDFIGNYSKNFMIPVALSGDRTYNSDVIRKYVIAGNNIIPGASTVHFDAISKTRIFNAIDNIKHATFKSLIKEGYYNLKNRLGRRPMLIDFYLNEEVDPLIIVREYKTYFAFISKMENDDNTFILTEKEKVILEYLSKTVLSGVRPTELEILRLLLLKSRFSFDEIIKNCRENYGYEVSAKQVKDACGVLQGKFVRDNAELEKYCDVDIVKSDETSYYSRALTYTELLVHKDFYNQVEDIIKVGLTRYKDKYSKPYSGEVPFVLYEKYSRRDVSFLMNTSKDLSSTMYGMTRIEDDAFIFVTYHKQETDDETKEYIDGKPDYADEFVNNIIFRWDAQIGNRLNGAYMNKFLNAPRKHLMVQKSEVENNFFYMGELDVDDVYEDKKKNNKGVYQPICKLRCKMHTPVREDLLKYLQSDSSLEEPIK